VRWFVTRRAQIFVATGILSDRGWLAEIRGGAGGIVGEVRLIVDFRCLYRPTADF
jgi:hypothetical protein